MLPRFVFRRQLVVVVALVLLLLGLGVSTTQAAGPAGAGTLYVVRHGDTLASIAMRFHVSPWGIAAANGVLNPNFIRAGQRLIIPSGVAAFVPVKAVAKGLPGNLTSGKLTYAVALKQYGPLIRQYRYKYPGTWHTVCRGETLSSIATRYRSHPIAIAAANLLPNPNVIYTGERVWVPKLW